MSIPAIELFVELGGFVKGYTYLAEIMVGLTVLRCSLWKSCGITYDLGDKELSLAITSSTIQTFPDNYFFCGSRTHHFTKVGNAMPSLLARGAEFVDEYM